MLGDLMLGDRAVIRIKDLHCMAVLSLGTQSLWYEARDFNEGQWVQAG